MSCETSRKGIDLRKRLRVTPDLERREPAGNVLGAARETGEADGTSNSEIRTGRPDGNLRTKITA
ncbi:hypothetical protein Ait01nite_053300 [Actinoplanes italicus]|nr:hypothetical protein Ait01nite_053300 [Actinoplanes italicus]